LVAVGEDVKKSLLQEDPRSPGTAGIEPDRARIADEHERAVALIRQEVQRSCHLWRQRRELRPKEN
jgi:hypothetical protein